MVKQLKDLCIKGEQGSSLMVCLNRYTKPQIKKILDLYGKKLLSSAKKQEMAEAAEAAVKEGLAAYFESDETKADKALMDAIITAPAHLSEITEFEPYERMYHRGMIFLRESGDQAETVVPAEIAAILHSDPSEDEDAYGLKEEQEGARAPKAAVKERTERERELIRYAKALANIYGVCTLVQLKEVWDLNHGRGIAPSEVRAALEKAGDEDGFYVDRGRVVNHILADRAAYEDIEAKYAAGDTHYYPPQDVVDAYENSMRMEDSPEYVYLRSFLLRKSSEETIGAVMHQLHLMALKDASANELVEYLKTQGISFADLDELNQFFSLYTGWFYHLRIWVCRGYMPCELRVEKMQQRNFKLPVDVDPNKRDKIGRNDTCPCGSGKKYKNCCLKLI